MALALGCQVKVGRVVSMVPLGATRTGEAGGATRNVSAALHALKPAASPLRSCHRYVPRQRKAVGVVAHTVPEHTLAAVNVRRNAVSLSSRRTRSS